MYGNASEERVGLENFVLNLNKVAHLNEVTEDRNTLYIINQYADLDSKEVSQHYAINVKPYFKVSNKNDAEYLGRARNKEIKKSELYDLDQAEELYKDYMKKYNKKNATKKFDRQLKYYRFIKTLVELNNNYLKGNSDVALDDKADVLKEPNEYFWPN
ncbi:unnamed protein product [Pieris macdunnoughi]|uniref:Uncharacterized protein n=1 Tax=Pieris macdunnoughi TaxID=345717 RepID=A0A821TDT3_9NEOP|nr:unnamed protein product [Pieris macdunnoughi]